MKNKRIISILLALIMILSEVSVFSTLTYGEENEADNGFVISEGVLLGLSDGKKEEIKSSGSVVIPEGVTEIGDHALQGLGIESVTLNSGLTKIGSYAFTDNNIKEVSFPDSLTEIADYAFRDNELTEINTGNVERIGVGVFQNNKITKLTLGESLISIGEEAFRTNDLAEVTIPNGVSEFGKGIFMDNNRYVRILGDNESISTERITGHYGHVVKSAIVVVKFVDKDTGKEIISLKTLGEDLSDEGSIFEIGKDNEYVAPSISGYLPVEKRVNIKPVNSGDIFEVKYMNTKVLPTITAPSKSFKPTDTIDEKALLEGVTATDFRGKDITSLIKVSPTSLDPGTPGFFDVTYSVTDEYGNTATKVVKVSVAIDWSKMEVSGGWVVGDFTFDGDTVTGFSESGKEKVKTNKDLYLPNVNTSGGGVVNIGFSAFKDNQLASVVIPEGVASISSEAFRNNKLTSVSIPNGVTSIGNSAFQSNKLTSVSIPNGVTSIGNSAFQSNKLTSVSIPNGVTSIGNSVFQNNKLTSVVIPEGVTSIGNSAFLSNQLASVTIPEGVTYIGRYAFEFNQLTSVVIPEGVMWIGYEAFRNNRLSFVIMPNNIDNMESRVFVNNTTYYNPYIVLYTSANKKPCNISPSDNYFSHHFYHSTGKGEVEWEDKDFIWNGGIVEGLSVSGIVKLGKTDKLVLPKKATKIGEYAFNEVGFTSVVIPEGVTSIGRHAFSSNQLTSVIIPKSVTSIGDSAFSDNKLTSVVIPEGVTSIGSFAFENNKLTSVVIPNGVTNIGVSAFRENKLTSVVIPDTVTKIGDYAFSYNAVNYLPAYRNGYVSNNVHAKIGVIYNPYKSSGIGDVIWEEDDFTWDGTKLIGFSFKGGEKLKLTDKLVIPDKATEIGYSAFKGVGFTSVVIPEGVTSIGREAFSNNQLTSVIIPEGVTSIGYMAFYNNKVNPLPAYRNGYTSNYNYADISYNPYKATGTGEVVWEEDDFSWDGTKLIGFSLKGGEKLKLTDKLVIPKKTTEIGKNAFYGVGFTSVTIPEGVTSIGDSAFSDNQLTSVTIPEGVTNIGNSAFEKNQLTSVTIPEGVTNIGNSAFEKNQLTSVTIPEGVTNIGNSAFEKNQLTSVTIPEGVTNIGNSAFSDNQLTSVVIPDGVTSIGGSAFKNNQLTSVVIPESIINIGWWAFSYNKLTSVVIPEGVTSIKSMVFAFNQLTSVVIPKGVKSIENGAFCNNQLTSVVIPEGVTNVGAFAFGGNPSISVTILNANTSIENNSFYSGDDKPSSVYIEKYSTNILDYENNAVCNPYKTTGIGDVAWEEDDFCWNDTTLIGFSFKGAEKLKLTDKLVIPEKATKIGYHAFYGVGFTSVIIPEGVVSIDDFAFSNNNLTSVIIPEGVTRIGAWAFENNKLTSVVIPDGVTSIGYEAFKSNQLTSVVIPETTTSIENNVFYMNPGDKRLNGKTPVYIKDREGNICNPNNLTNKENYIINLKDITIRYVDEKGSELFSSKNFLTEKLSLIHI